MSGLFKKAKEARAFAGSKRWTGRDPAESFNPQERTVAPGPRRGSRSADTPLGPKRGRL